MGPERDAARDIANALARRPIAGDGAMGTALLARGAPVSACLEELVLRAPELVRAIHAEHVAAGATLVETCSFGANRVRLAAHGLTGEGRALNVAAARVAREASGEGVWIAGSIGPTGTRFDALDARGRLEARAAFEEQAGALVEGGVDLLWIETMRDVREAELAVVAARAATRELVPIVALLALDDDLPLAGASSLDEAFARLVGAGAFAAGPSCCASARVAIEATRAAIAAGAIAIATPSAGLPAREGDRLVYPRTPDDLGDLARRLYDAGARVVGGCCGTTAAHVAKIAAAAARASSADTV